MAKPNALTRQFDDAAQLYDEVRPRYPEAMVESILAFAALPADGRIFEVGCGTGQMTLPFARRGYGIVAIDQGERLAALAAQHCQPYPQVRVVPCAFEAWQDTPGSYDLFLAAQAIHWIEPQYSVVRAAELLKPRGTIALVWTADRSQGSAFWQATAPIYDQYNPVDAAATLQPRWPDEAYRQALRTSGPFGALQEIRHAWTRRYAGEAYIKLLWTFSDHRAMPEPNRSRFFEAIREVIVQMGGEVVRHYETVALLAKKRA
jgi:SAM-dependent methyltransferase